LAHGGLFIAEGEMADQPVMGSGPVAINHEGKFVLIPLDKLVFRDGKLEVTDSAYDHAREYLRSLATQGVLRPGKVPPARRAFKWTAAAPGALGNNTAIEVAYPRPVSPDAFRVLVRRTDVYSDLTLSTIEGVLGAGTTPGSRPGLVKLKAAPSTEPPVALVRKPLVRGGANEVEVAGSTVTAFTLVAARDPAGSPDGEEFHVAVSEPAVDGSFTLTAEWSKTVENIDRATAQASLGRFSYLVSVTLPDGSAVPATLVDLPAAGTFVLGGGTDARSATSAKTETNAR